MTSGGGQDVFGGVCVGFTGEVSGGFAGTGIQSLLAFGAERVSSWCLEVSDRWAERGCMFGILLEPRLKHLPDTKAVRCVQLVPWSKYLQGT